MEGNLFRSVTHSIVSLVFYEKSSFEGKQSRQFYPFPSCVSPYSHSFLRCLQDEQYFHLSLTKETGCFLRSNENQIERREMAAAVSSLFFIYISPGLYFVDASWSYFERPFSKKESLKQYESYITEK